jgi:hypothetical protein
VAKSLRQAVELQIEMPGRRSPHHQTTSDALLSAVDGGLHDTVGCMQLTCTGPSISSRAQLLPLRVAGLVSAEDALTLGSPDGEN